jgi:hypothetical protein
LSTFVGDYFVSPAGGSVAGGVSVSVPGAGVAGVAGVVSSDLAQPPMTIAVTTSIKAKNFFMF